MACTPNEHRKKQWTKYRLSLRARLMNVQSINNAARMRLTVFSYSSQRPVFSSSSTHVNWWPAFNVAYNICKNLVGLELSISWTKECQCKRNAIDYAQLVFASSAHELSSEGCQFFVRTGLAQYDCPLSLSYKTCTERILFGWKSM